MDGETIFRICSAIAFAGWIGLAAAPLARARAVAFARIAAAVLCLAYLLQFAFTLEPVEGGSFTTLSGVVALFSSPANVMFGWTHYLAFDLFIGSWEAEDAGKRGIAHWIVLPCLFLTLMVGPVGLLLYLLIRWFLSNRPGKETHD